MRSPELNSAILRIKQAPRADFKMESFKGSLRDHQTVGSAFIVMAQRGMVLDFVGAGKTPVTIAAHVKLAEIGKVERVLVVCEGGLKYQWKEEYEKFSDMQTVIVTGTKANRTQAYVEGQSAQVTITHYESVRADIETVLNMNYDMVVFDEASVFKTHGTTLAESLRRLTTYRPDKIPYRYALTATAIEKRLEDLFSIMEKLEPTILGDFEEFMYNHVIVKRFRTKEGRPFDKVVGYRDIDLIRSKIDPYFIKRTRDQVYGKTKERIRTPRKLELDGDQRKAYDKIASGVSLDDNRLQLLQAFRHLEYVCDGLFMFKDQPSKKSVKMDTLMFFLQNELEGEKVVIFAKWHEVLDQIQERLKKAGISYVRYSGRQSELERENAKKSFNNDPSIRVILLTQAGRRGINLPAARYMIFFNRIWNPAIEEQLMGRIDRPEVQVSPWVNGIFFICKDTLEETLDRRMLKEKGLSESLFGKDSDETVHEDGDIMPSTGTLYSLVKHNSIGDEHGTDPDPGSSTHLSD